MGQMGQLLALVNYVNIWLVCSQVDLLSRMLFPVLYNKAWSQDHHAGDIREKQPFWAGDIAPFGEHLVCKPEDLSSESSMQIKSHM